MSTALARILLIAGGTAIAGVVAVLVWGFLIQPSRDVGSIAVGGQAWTVADKQRSLITDASSCSTVGPYRWIDGPERLTHTDDIAGYRIAAVADRAGEELLSVVVPASGGSITGLPQKRTDHGNTLVDESSAHCAVATFGTGGGNQTITVSLHFDDGEWKRVELVEKTG